LPALLHLLASDLLIRAAIVSAGGFAIAGNESLGVGG